MQFENYHCTKFNQLLFAGKYVTKAEELSLKDNQYFWMEWLDPANPNKISFGEGLVLGKNPLLEWLVEPDFDIDTIEVVKAPGTRAKLG